jgi:hypothetical protein
MSDGADAPSVIEHDPDVLDMKDVAAYERDAIQLARLDPSFYCEYVFGWTNQPCHDDWHALCSDNDRLVIFAPVEHGKSSQISMGRLSWEIGKNPNIRSACISDAASQAQKFLGVVRQTIQYNERYHRVFPNVRPERRRGRVQGWQDSHIVVEREDLNNKDYTVQALGVLGSIMGSRLDLTILDDILDFENTLTATQRRRMIEWLKTSVLSRATAAGKVWMIGNAWHDEDAMHWAAKNPRFRVEFFDAEDGLWPDLIVMPSGEVCGWPKWRLEERKQEVGVIEYNRSMRNIAMREGATDDFKREDIEYCVELAERAHEELVNEYHGNEMLVYVGVDLGIQKKSGSHYTVFFVVGVDPKGIKHVLNIYVGRMGLVEIVKHFVRIQEDFKPVLFMVENNAAQDYLLQFFRGAEDIFRAILLNDPDAGGDATKLRTVASRIRLKPFTTGTNKADPVLGVRAMSVDFAAHKWRIPRHRQSEEWIKEMIRFDPSEHTGDRLMASWFATHACSSRRRVRLRVSSIGVGG